MIFHIETFHFTLEDTALSLPSSSAKFLSSKCLHCDIQESTLSFQSVPTASWTSCLSKHLSPPSRITSQPLFTTDCLADGRSINIPQINKQKLNLFWSLRQNIVGFGVYLFPLTVLFLNKYTLYLNYYNQKRLNSTHYFVPCFFHLLHYVIKYSCYQSILMIT